MRTPSFTSRLARVGQQAPHACATVRCVERLHPSLARAVRNRVLLDFDYVASSRRRVVAPYCRGCNATGEVLRAIQVRAESYQPNDRAMTEIHCNVQR